MIRPFQFKSKCILNLRDAWWVQAQARCHRIGQTRNVKIYRFITVKTYERRMFVPEPETRKLETRNPKPETRNPKPETRDPKFETRNLKIKYRNPKPET